PRSAPSPLRGQSPVPLLGEDAEAGELRWKLGGKTPRIADRLRDVVCIRLRSDVSDEHRSRPPVDRDEIRPAAAAERLRQPVSRAEPRARDHLPAGSEPAAPALDLTCLDRRAGLRGELWIVRIPPGGPRRQPPSGGR